MSNIPEERATRAFEKIKVWSSLSDLNDVNRYLDDSKKVKKRTFLDNFDSWITINHPRITFITFIAIIILIAITLYK